MNALARLGMVSEIPSENQTMMDTAVCANGVGDDQAVPKDYFVERDGVRFAGTHLLIDIWGASRLDEPELIDETLRAGALAAGATILHSHFHHFTPNGGVSGVVVLAESHISIHTWPERGFAALDIFMCGDCNPYKAIPLIKAAFTPTDVQVGEQRRGLTS
jgi:S-adenosylmethionine decarboxylase